MKRKLKNLAVPQLVLSKGTRLAEGESVHFILPTGQHCELYHEIDFLGNSCRHFKSTPMAARDKGNCATSS